jgi:DNA repair photolyase
MNNDNDLRAIAANPKYTYWDLQKIAAKLVPRMTRIPNSDVYRQKEKGRKSNYQQFNILENNMVKMERLLDTQGIESFAEVSLRAQSCPMPLNIDVWDGLQCSYRCRYCFADYFRHSLYTSFFDNSKQIGLRSCSEEFYKRELDKLIPHVGEETQGDNSVLNAVRLKIPMRLGIRFEDFLPKERKSGVSLGLLRYLSDASYPLMINTKSDLVGFDEYAEALAGNPAGAAVHITLISSDEEFLRKMEPGAPSFQRRLTAARNLVKAGVRVVARIEPWMMFLNDSKDKVTEYIGAIKDAGVEYMTFDSYSYSAYSKGIAENFHSQGWDFERMFLLSSDSQWLSSLFLGAFMDLFRAEGLHVNTFDQGNAPDNEDVICCSVGDWFEEKAQSKFNLGSGIGAIKFIQWQEGAKVTWGEFEDWVFMNSGWLSSQLRKEVRLLWNGDGDGAWPIFWAKGLKAVGQDKDGVVWKFDKNSDFRYDLLERGGLIK